MTTYTPAPPVRYTDPTSGKTYNVPAYWVALMGAGK